MSGSGSLRSWHQGPLLAELGGSSMSAIDTRPSHRPNALPAPLRISWQPPAAQFML